MHFNFWILIKLDPHYRFFVRGLTKKTVLYTEMIVDDTVTHSPNLAMLIGHNIDEQPSVIQLGGYNPETLGAAAEICSTYGSYDEINLNCGCPSQRVSKRLDCLLFGLFRLLTNCLFLGASVQN